MSEPLTRKDYPNLPPHILDALNYLASLDSIIAALRAKLAQVTAERETRYTRDECEALCEIARIATAAGYQADNKKIEGKLASVTAENRNRHRICTQLQHQLAEAKARIKELEAR